MGDIDNAIDESYRRGSVQAFAFTMEELNIRNDHLTLLNKQPEDYELAAVSNTPIFTMPVLKHAETLENAGKAAPFTQYGLIGGNTNLLRNAPSSGTDMDMDPRLFFNVAAPSSTFICGSQGSGKSHTLSCLLENCLIGSKAGALYKPLTGLVFHYDAFISDDGGSPCEAAYLATHPDVKVKVLCAPTNLSTIKVRSAR